MPTRLIVLLAWIALVPAVSAHEGGDPWLHVPADHVIPGGELTVIAADFGPETEVDVLIVQDEATHSVGRAATDADGHFTTTFTVPGDLANGYVELVGTGADGSEAATWILVGPRDAAAGSPPAEVSDWWTDPSVIVLALLLSGTLLAFGFYLIRTRPPAASTVRPAKKERSSPSKSTARGPERSR